MDGLTPEEMKTAESNANIDKLQRIQSCWPVGSIPVCRPGRLFVHECVLSKMCRKGLKARSFWLFNDILMYGSQITKGKYKSQAVMQLHEISVVDIEDSAEGSNGLQLNDKRKSFVVYCSSLNEKALLLKLMTRFIKLSRGAKGLKAEKVDTRAVWVPDVKVKVCMLCDSAFSMLNRKHHCRNCGKVVCGPCSVFKAVLNLDKSERVCSNCHTKLGGKQPTDVPVLGTASTENDLGKAKRNVNDDDSDYTSSDDDDDDVTVSDSEAKGNEDAAVRQAAQEWLEQNQELESQPDTEATEVLTPVSKVPTVPTGPYAVAIYDNDDPEHPDEIKFFMDAVLCLTRALDDEWLEGYLWAESEKKVGIFPAAFVQVVVPLDA